MSVIAAFNIKGGVGKTATAINLSYLSARNEQETLLWDLDPQGASSFTLRTRTRIRGGGRRVIQGRVVLDDLIRGSDFAHLDVVPADLSNRKMEHALGASDDSKDAFLSALRPAVEQYDHVFLDCGPHLSELSECIFSAADALVCPTIPTPLSLRTLAQLMKHLKKRSGHRPLVLPFFCMVDRRKALHRDTCNWVFDQDLGFLDSTIPYSSIVEQMSAKRAPLFEYAQRSRPARAYQALWDEVQSRLACGERPSTYAKTTRQALEQAARNGDRSAGHSWFRRKPDTRMGSQPSSEDRR